MTQITRYLRDGFQGDLTTLSTLQLLCGFDSRQAAEYCMVSPETYRRWLTDREPNATAVRLLSVRAGYLPWPGWEDWEMHNGFLFPPGYSNGGLTSGSLFAIPYLRELVKEQQRHVAQLEAAVAGPRRRRR